MDEQCASAVLMVRPGGFQYNTETAATNTFMASPRISPADTHAAALEEFDNAAGALRRARIDVIIADDDPEHPSPDAIFPNNWLSTHSDGTVVLYPMHAPSRRRERRSAVLDLLEQSGFAISRVVDLTDLEDQGVFLEGTGSMVLDRVNRIAYAARSPRTHERGLEQFAAALDYETVVFDAVDESGVPLYHTNVCMTIGADFAIICTRAITDAAQRRDVLSRLRMSREIIDITPEQLRAFAGNMLGLRDASGAQRIVCSSTAARALDTRQRERLADCGEGIIVDIPFIERTSGGGVRCMLAEVFR